MVKKYEITSDCKTVDNVKVCRVKALKDFNANKFVNIKKGDLGGYVEKESNLSQEGGAWVFVDAVVKDNAMVSDDAWIDFDAVVSGNARVEGTALVGGEARVSDNAMVKDKAEVVDSVVIKDNAVVEGNALVEDHAVVSGNAVVDGAVVKDKALVKDDVKVSGTARVECHTKLLDSVKVSRGRVCVSEDIVFDSQEKLDNYLEYVKKYER